MDRTRRVKFGLLVVDVVLHVIITMMARCTEHKYLEDYLLICTVNVFIRISQAVIIFEQHKISDPQITQVIESMKSNTANIDGKNCSLCLDNLKEGCILLCSHLFHA